MCKVSLLAWGIQSEAADLCMMVLILMLPLIATGSTYNVLPSCSTISTTLPTVDTMVNVSCTSVLLANVIVQGNMTLNISITGIIAANPSSEKITVTISNMTLRQGPTLVIDSRGYTTSSTGGGPTASILIQSLIGNDGSLVFIGTFPPGSSILVNGAQMTSSSSAAPTLFALDPSFPGYRKMVMLISVSLTGNSCLIFTNSSLVFTNPIVNVIFFTSGTIAMNFSNGSALILQNCSMLTINGEALIMLNPVVFSNFSYMAVNSCNMTAGGGTAFSMSSTVSFTSSSYLTLRSCYMTSGGWNTRGDVFVLHNDIIFSGSSYVVLSSCAMIADAGYAFLLANTATFSDSSFLVLTNSTMIAGGGWALRISGAANFTGFSYFALCSCTMTAPGGLYGAFYVGSVATFTNSCYLIVDSSTFTAGGGYGFRVERAVSFTNFSFLVIRSCNITAGWRVLVFFASATFTNCSYFVVTSCSMSASSGHAFSMSRVTFTSSSYLSVIACNMTAASAFLFRTVSLANFSSFTVTSCNMTCRSTVFNINSSVIISSSSSWIFVMCTFTTSFIAVGFVGSSVAILNSKWKFDQCSFFGSNGLWFASTNVEISGGSVWEVSNSNFRASYTFPFSGGLMFSKDFRNSSAPGSSFKLRDMSLWNVSNCSFIAEMGAPAILFSDTDVIVENGSSWTVVDCVMISTGTGGSFTFSGSVLMVQQSSEFKILRSTLTATSSAGISITAKSMIMIHQLSVFVIENGTLRGSPSALLAAKDSMIQLETLSACVVTGVVLVSSGSAPVVQLNGGIFIAPSSMFTLRVNSMQMSSPAAGGQICVDLGLLTLSDWAAVQVTDNNCSAAISDGVTFLSAEIKASGGHAGLVVERCNNVNGALWRPLKSSPPGDFSGMVSLQCGRCDRTVDCFWPLTEMGLTKMDCANGSGRAARNCPCIASCGGEPDLMCLPGLGTTASDGTAPPPGCNLNSADSRPMLRTTWTVSENETFTRSATTSMSQRPPGENDLMLKSAGRQRSLRALHAATVAFATTAVLLSGPSGAGMMQRMQAQQLLNSCGEKGRGDGSMDFSSSPTQMKLGPDDSSAGHSNVSNAYVRGTVVGNLLIWLACVVVACAVVKVVKLRRRDDSSWVTVAAELELPGRLYWPYSMLSVPALTSSVMLLVPTGVPQVVRLGDGALAALGIAVCTAAAASIALVTTGRRFRATATEFSAGDVAKPLSENSGGISSMFLRCKKWVQLELSSRWKWVDRRRARGFVKRWGALFDAYGKGRQWFVVVELAVSTSAAVLAGLVLLDDGHGAVCQVLQVLSAVAAVAFLAAVVLLQPYGSPMDGRLAIGNAAVAAVSSVLGLLDIDTVILTLAQAIVNGVTALLVTATAAVDGTFFRVLSSKSFRCSDIRAFVKSTLTGRPSTHIRTEGDNARTTDLDRVNALRERIGNRVDSANCPETLERMLAGLPPTAAEKMRALGALVSIICEQNFLHDTPLTLPAHQEELL